ncbi:hypothetical protein M0R45_034881 [Rubus argutus]|uniref:Carotenoid cleavage dioxygenase 7 n=1 Tax=Rubus argutus TaxID=59490 RepID=A0AAW1VV78_RUBAR
MQAKYHFQVIPKPIFLSLINISPMHRPPPLPRLLKQPRAISTSTPNEPESSTPVTTSTLQVVDDSVAAFWDYQFLFVSQRSETNEPVTLQIVEGAVPPEFPSGTYYLAGPGLFRDDHGLTLHPLDGHGYLRAFSFDGVNGDEVHVKFMAKYVKTEAQMEEHDPVTDTWRFRHRGLFSVLKRGQKVWMTKVMKNVANTTVLRWGGRLFCLWDGGEPYEIESETLDTVGKVKLMDGWDSVVEGGSDYGDVWDVTARLLRPILSGVLKMPVKRLLSHYKFDARKNRLLMMSCNAEDILLARNNFTFYEFDSNFKQVGKKEFIIPDHLMIHDWAFTATYYILFANRVKLDVAGTVTSVCGITPTITALSVNPSKDTSPIYLLPRFPNEVNYSRDWRVPIEAPSQLWLLHVGNAYENLDENWNSEIQIHASVCSYEWFTLQKLLGYDWQSGKLDPSIVNLYGNESKTLLPHLVQVSINLDANGICQSCGVEPLNKWNKSSDLPVINPAFSGSKNKYMYAAAASGSRSALPNFPYDMVVKLNVSTKSVHTWSAGSRRFIGEPAFIAKGSEEDDGYVLVVEYAVAVQRCYLVILDSQKIGAADALVARLEVPKHLNFPFGFHGFWASDE